MQIPLDPTAVALAAVASPFAVWAFKAGVRWAVNGTFVRKDVFQAQISALSDEVKRVRENTDKIIDHLLQQ